MTPDEQDALLDLLARRLTYWRDRAIKAEYTFKPGTRYIAARDAIVDEACRMRDSDAGVIASNRDLFSAVDLMREEFIR